MATLTIYHGAMTPIRSTGIHCIRLLEFAEKFRGWHSFAPDRTTKRAISSLAKLDCIEIADSQFRFKYPKVTHDLKSSI